MTEQPNLQQIIEQGWKLFAVEGTAQAFDIYGGSLDPRILLREPQQDGFPLPSDEELKKKYHELGWRDIRITDASDRSGNPIPNMKAVYVYRNLRQILEKEGWELLKYVSTYKIFTENRSKLGPGISLEKLQPPLSDEELIGKYGEEHEIKIAPAVDKLGYLIKDMKAVYIRKGK
jgi:hypothetical protein|tara:strand:- start:213 stop:737 length:525 start_codon:yes stop_codon:yes gene_type:complete